MHGYGRASSGRISGNSPTSTPSPPSSPRFRHGRSKIAGGGRSPKLQTVAERAIYVLLSAVLRRRGILLFAPLMYVSGMLMYMGTLDFEVSGGVVVRRRLVPGSTYRSPEVFQKLWPHMQADGNRSNALSRYNSALGSDASACLPPTLEGEHRALSYKLEFSNLCSKFRDIFDEDYFIDALKNDVRVVKELPEDVLRQFDYNISNIVNLRVKAWSSSTYYLHKVLPKLQQMGAVRIAPFSNRLAHSVPSYIQGLRCSANFEALRFSEPIRTLAENMVDRMIKNNTNSGGKYVSVHLRFEEDMVAFSCCIYDGGEEEKREMDKARERGWRGKFRKPGRVIKPGEIRRDGKCPLTPLEVGMMLRGMGFDNTTTVYVAAGKIYKAERFMAPLRQLFPLLETKETIASPDELAPFKGHSSRLAALDYTICLHSEVFVTTQGGNFPHFLMGHRRYLYGGHAKTIKPDKRRLAVLFDNPKISARQHVLMERRGLSEGDSADVHSYLDDVQ
ncbi:hypothetical protein ACLOJK_001116, partial [Asimina triloba]